MKLDLRIMCNKPVIKSEISSNECTSLANKILFVLLALRFFMKLDMVNIEVNTIKLLKGKEECWLYLYLRIKSAMYLIRY